MSIVTIHTNQGEIKVKLFDETPLHRDNFLKLIEEGVYTDMLFHRVIRGFMVQGGDIATHSHKSDNKSLAQRLDYQVEAEFCLPNLFHRRGALAAARLPDEMNPERASSPTQFYIVTGEAYTDNQLNDIERKRLEQFKLDILKRIQAENTEKVKELYRTGDRAVLSDFRDGLQKRAATEAEKRRSEMMFTDEQRDAYSVIGGTPQLDGVYTVFGAVIEGMNVVDKIEQSVTSHGDKPIQDIRMTIRK